MTTEQSNIYPNLGDVIHYENISDKVEKNLSDARIKEIQARRHEMEMNLKHYRKILQRWKRFGNALRISSLIIVFGCTIPLTASGFVVLVIPPFVTGILALVGIGEGALSEVFIFGLVKKKKEFFQKKIEHIQEYISKSWYLFEKIRSDGKVTLQEVNEFGNLMEEYEKGLSVVEDDLMDKEYLKLRESLKSQVEKEVRKDIKEDIKKGLKDEIKQKYLSK